ncbi:MAG: hypothetical protein ACM32O_00265, partial [Clostridia bacterium]
MISSFFQTASLVFLTSILLITGNGSMQQTQPRNVATPMDDVKQEKDPILEEAFANVFGLKRGVDQVKYVFARIDLNGDHKPETFVYLMGPSVCGSGGCNAALFSREGNTYSMISTFTLVSLPVWVSKEQTNGWNDLIVTVTGGGLPKTVEKVLRFDGHSYPLNPSVQPEAKRQKSDE